MDKQAFFNAGRRKTKTVEVQGRTIEIQALSLAQREKLGAMVSESSAKGVAWIVVSGVTAADVVMQYLDTVYKNVSQQAVLMGLNREAEG